VQKIIGNKKEPLMKELVRKSNSKSNEGNRSGRWADSHVKGMLQSLRGNV
jgi:hypothetical protein